MAATKELIVTSLGEDSYVDVHENDTLLQVRALILEELDEEQLPAKDFSFKVNGIRISSKQEGRKVVFDLLAKNAKIELVTKSIKQPAEQSSLEEEPESNKRAKTSSYVTPKEVNEESIGPQKAPPAKQPLEKPSPVSLDSRLANDNADQTDANDDDNYMPQADNDSGERIEHRVSVDSVEEQEHTETESSKGHDSNVLSETSIEKTSDDLEEDAKNDSSHDDIQMFEADNPYKESNEAKEKSNHVLERLKALLQDNPLFCSDTRRQEWLHKIQNLKKKSTPQTVFGVLGNTGV
jgi:hypothetical protein